MDEQTRLFLAGINGDEVSLTRWARKAQVDVWRLCASLVGPAEADDLTQETFERAFRNAHTFRGDSTVRTWLLSIARRTCVDSIRRKVRLRRLTTSLFSRDEVPAPTGVEVDDLLSGLDSDRRTAFVLTQLLGLSYAEAAEVSGCAVGTIRSRVARARAELAEVLADQDRASG
jgi:RNA polymerase sigma-70 factor (ECF subfamily)